MSMNPYDEEKLGKQAIVDFSSIRKKTADANAQASTETKPSEEGVVSKPATPREEMQAKVATAKVHANREIEQFKKIVANTKAEMEKLCIFKNVGDAVEGICQKYILEMVLEPIIKGNIPYGMPEEMFRAIRADIYRALIETYVDKPEENS